MSELDPGLLTARYGYPLDLPADILARGNFALETILAHRSVRSYDSRPLEPGLLEMLIAAAESAATSSNLHTYSIIAVEDPARKAELSVLAGRQQHIVDSPLLLLFCADLARLTSLCESGDTSSDVLGYAEMFIMAVVDAALAAQNLVIAAESLGLGTCYIGGARNHPAEVAKLLKLPPRVFVTFGLTVGYPLARTEAVKPRLRQDGGILHREQYNSECMPAVEAYDRAMKRFNSDQSGREGRGWIEPTIRRVATPESLGAERPQIKSYLESIGMALK